MARLGPRLRARRVELGLTLQRIADRLDVAPIYVSDVEREKRRPIRREGLIALAKAYELPFSEVEQLAMASRDSVQIDTSRSSESAKQAAVLLARAWPELSDAKIVRLREVLEEEGDSR